MIPLRIVGTCALAALLAGGFASGCALYGDTKKPCGVYEPPVKTRDEALACAHHVYEVAVQQGALSGGGGCIYRSEPPERWVVVVDETNKRSFGEAASDCSTFASGRIKHAVVLDRKGNVRFAR